MFYLIDTNILLFPYKISNPLDFHPTFWSKMKLILERDDVISIDKVKDEIYYLEDDLSDWCKLNIARKFWNSTNSCLEQYAEIQNWAQNQNYNERALLQFAELKNADPFLLAFALNYKLNNKQDITIVTQEVSNPNSLKIIKLPDACNSFNVRFININQFFREIRISF